MSFTNPSHSGSNFDSKPPNNMFPEKISDHVMCFGTFDIFHPGHVFYLSEAQKFAKKMTIIVARDTRVLKIKGKLPKDSEEKRKQNVSCAFKDVQVVLGDKKDVFAPLRLYKPDILAFGYDQHVPEDAIRQIFPDIKIVRIDGYETERWKSSILREKLTQESF